MNKIEFRAEMIALITELIPTIGDEYRAHEESDEPSMQVTVGANSEGWGYQTGDNSFTGGAYSFSDWAVVYLDRESNPETIADEIISELESLESDDAIFVEDTDA